MNRSGKVVTTSLVATLPSPGVALAGTNSVAFGTGEHRIEGPVDVTTLRVEAVGDPDGTGRFEVAGDLVVGGGGGVSDVRLRRMTVGLTPTDSRVLGLMPAIDALLELSGPATEGTQT